jgi:hypothetical protein
MVDWWKLSKLVGWSSEALDFPDNFPRQNCVTSDNTGSDTSRHLPRQVVGRRHLLMKPEPQADVIYFIPLSYPSLWF